MTTTRETNPHSGQPYPIGPGETVETKHLFAEGASLVGPRGDQENPEYERAIVELIASVAGFNSDHLAIVATAIGLDPGRWLA